MVVSRKDLNEMIEAFCKKETNGTFSCTKCQAIRNKKPHIQEHAQIHINCEWKCENCWRVFKTSSVLRTHNNRSKCAQDLCQYTGQSRKDTLETEIQEDKLTRERIIYQNQQKDILIDSSSNVSKTSTLTKPTLDTAYVSKESSLTKIPQFCKIEGEMFSVKDLNKMMEQLYQKRSENLYCCLKCPTALKFTEKFNMEEHAQTHVNELEFKCTFCDKIFKTTSTLRKHNIKIHS